MPTLFVVIPVFNESKTLRELLAAVQSVALPSGWTLESIIVDDGSDAITAREIECLERSSHRPLIALRHAVNCGKGAALRTGFTRAIARSSHPSDAVIVQDADLEYDPHEYVRLLEALTESQYTVAVFGNRWHLPTGCTGWKRRVHRVGNGVLTWVSNLATGLGVSDMECCYKLVTVCVLKALMPSLTENRFGIEPQLTAALARAGVRVIEVPVSYRPRSFRDGKKIGPVDGIRALWVIVRSKFIG